MKVVTVVGARPQFVKAAAVSRPLRERHEEILVHTGQHYDPGLSDVFFQELQIPRPDHELHVGSGGHGVQTGRMLAALEPVLLEEGPDAVLVYGDTNSTVAGALAAAKLHIPVAHVEAGLRSGDRAMPEELNRIVTDHLATDLYCPGPAAARNLEKEGITRGVHVVGDVMVDVFRMHEAASREDTRVLDGLRLGSGAYWVLTMHRPANTDDPARLARILESIRGLAKTDVRFVWPMHPRTRHALARTDIAVPENVHVVDPLAYRSMQALLLHALGLVTDSGGMQKEALLAGKPCITLRDTTEWPETVDAGWNRLVDDDAAALAQAVSTFRPQGTPPDLFGDGHTAGRIVARLEQMT